LGIGQWLAEKAPFICALFFKSSDSAYWISFLFWASGASVYISHLLVDYEVSFDGPDRCKFYVWLKRSQL